MEIAQLSIKHSSALNELLRTVENSLDNNDFWLPINSKSRENFFNTDWTRFYGAFIDDKLVGAVGLFFNQHEFGESFGVLKNNVVEVSECDSVVEVGRLMVHPQFRNIGVGKTLVKEVLKSAIGYDLIIATVHPDNVPSKSIFTDLGFIDGCTYKKKCGYIRTITYKQSTI